MKTLLAILSTLCCSYLQAQTIIKGAITDQNGEVIIGANIYLKDTYDGTSSDLQGYFEFQTEERGGQTLVISAVGYASHEQTITINDKAISFNIVLKESINKMNAITITAGIFGASNQGKAIVLEPLDIVTTASAMGDIAGALQTLPGTQTVGEDGRLFIRGGESYETKVYIDGVLIHTPFNAKTPNLPTRGRFSPFLFKGTTFSTGGYSAEYGQALSSALILNTTDFPEQNQTDFSIMSVGLDATHQHHWEKTSIAVKGEYTNLSPYQDLIKQAFDWEEAPRSAGGSLVFRKKISKAGLLKTYSNYTQYLPCISLMWMILLILTI